MLYDKFDTNLLEICMCLCWTCCSRSKNTRICLHWANIQESTVYKLWSKVYIYKVWFLPEKCPVVFLAWVCIIWLSFKSFSLLVIFAWRDFSYIIYWIIKIMVYFECSLIYANLQVQAHIFISILLNCDTLYIT